MLWRRSLPKILSVGLHIAAMFHPTENRCKRLFRYLRTSAFPERKGRSNQGCGAVSPYKKYLLEQWNSGCHDTKKLYGEIYS